MKGSFSVVVDDGWVCDEVLLDSLFYGLYILFMVWGI